MGRTKTTDQLGCQTNGVGQSSSQNRLKPGRPSLHQELHRLILDDEQEQFLCDRLASTNVKIAVFNRRFRWVRLGVIIRVHAPYTPSLLLTCCFFPEDRVYVYTHNHAYTGNIYHIWCQSLMHPMQQESPSRTTFMQTPVESAKSATLKPNPHKFKN